MGMALVKNHTVNFVKDAQGNAVLAIHLTVKGVLLVALY